jgi:hypothetical protein
VLRRAAMTQMTIRMRQQYERNQSAMLRRNVMNHINKLAATQ